MNNAGLLVPKHLSTSIILTYHKRALQIMTLESNFSNFTVSRTLVICLFI